MPERSCLWGWTVWTCWLLVTPLIFLYYALKVYVWGFLSIYLRRAGTQLFCGLCILCGWTYVDKDFNGDAAIVGGTKKGGDFSNILASVDMKDVRWLRIGEVCRSMGYLDGKDVPLLFAEKIEPADILQGGLGDCWLLAGIASVAMHPHLIRRIFVQREYSPTGRYKLRLYDRETLQPRTVVVDDRIPCDKDGQPLFAKPNGKEAWVLLLEKAFAKMWGSYQALDGGLTEWAIQSMLGCPSIYYRRKANVWVRVAVHGPVEEAKKQVGKSVTNDEMFKVLSLFLKLGSLVSTSMHDEEAGLEHVNTHGLVNAHAYSLLRTVSAKAQDGTKVRLVSLRNPWGRGEWEGAWSDNSPMWEQNPKVKEAANVVAKDDGSFWMPWDEFSRSFEMVQVMARDLGAKNLLMDYDESRPCLGPLAGCTCGLLSYCCCCVGCRAVCCAAEADYVAETGPTDAKCLSRRWWYNHLVSSE